MTATSNIFVRAAGATGTAAMIASRVPSSVGCMGRGATANWCSKADMRANALGVSNGLRCLVWLTDWQMEPIKLIVCSCVALDWIISVRAPETNNCPPLSENFSRNEPKTTSERLATSSGWPSQNDASLPTLEREGVCILDNNTSSISLSSSLVGVFLLLFLLSLLLPLLFVELFCFWGDSFSLSFSPDLLAEERKIRVVAVAGEVKPPSS